MGAEKRCSECDVALVKRGAGVYVDAGRQAGTRVVLGPVYVGLIDIW